MASSRKIFTYEEAAALFPEAARLTESAVEELRSTFEVDEDGEPVHVPREARPIFEEVVSRWAATMGDLGIEVKGLWLIDFDSGSGYYCWRYPEPALQHYHGYDEGFGGRVKLT